MPANCGLANSGNYARPAQPRRLLPERRGRMRRRRRPSGTPAAGALATDLAAGTLPSYGLFIPNLCNDGHNSCNGVAPRRRGGRDHRDVDARDPGLARLPERPSAGRDHGRLEPLAVQRQPAGNGAHEPRRRRGDAGRDPYTTTRCCGWTRSCSACRRSQTPRRRPTWRRRSTCRCPRRLRCLRRRRRTCKQSVRVTRGRPRRAYDADIDGQARQRRMGRAHGAA